MPVNKIKNLGKYAEKGAKPWNAGMGKQDKVVCIICSKEFGVVPNRKNKAKYCSSLCYGQSRKKIYEDNRKKFFCEECGINFLNKPSRNSRFCSAMCRAKNIGRAKLGVALSLEVREKMSLSQRGSEKPNLRGKKHFNWKGGKSKNRHKGQEYKQWRTAVFKRDNYTCQECGKKNIFLNVHHIQDWKNYPKLRFDINNGQTLCVFCHATIDFKYKNLILGQIGKGLLFQSSH